MLICAWHIRRLESNLEHRQQFAVSRIRIHTQILPGKVPFVKEYRDEITKRG